MKKPDAYQIVKRLLDYSRQEKKWPDAKLAERAAIAHAVVSNHRLGRTAPSLAHFFAYCDALDVQPENAIIGHPEGIPPRSLQVGGLTYILEED